MAAPDVHAGLDEEQRSYLTSLDSTTITCKADKRHDFGKLVPGKPPPRGFRSERLNGELAGCYEITETCRICGRRRRTLTAPGGYLGAGAKRLGYLGGQEGYIATGLGLTTADYKNEHGLRYAETVVEAAQRAAKG